jgi:hypothetical protein
MVFFIGQPYPRDIPELFIYLIRMIVEALI